MERNLDEIEKVANSFRSYEQMYDDLLKFGIDSIAYLYDTEDTTWKKLELEWVLEYFTKKEDFEKCNIIKNYISKHFIANKELQIILNERLRGNEETFNKKILRGKER